jgi:hypothetical protein
MATAKILLKGRSQFFKGEGGSENLLMNLYLRLFQLSRDIRIFLILIIPIIIIIWHISDSSSIQTFLKNSEVGGGAQMPTLPPPDLRPWFRVRNLLTNHRRLKSE